MPSIHSAVQMCTCPRRGTHATPAHLQQLTAVPLCFTLLQEGLGRAEWVHHCTYRGGSDLAFLGNTGSQLVVARQGDRGGCIIRLWDTLLPPESACVHEVGVVT